MSFKQRRGLFSTTLQAWRAGLARADKKGLPPAAPRRLQNTPQATSVSTDGTLADAASETILDAIAGTQIQQAIVAGAASDTTAGTPAGTQMQVGIASPATSLTTVSTAAATQTDQGAVAGAMSATALSTPTGTQVHVGAAAGATSSTLLSTPAGVNAMQGAVSDAISATALDAPAGTQVQQGTVAGVTSATGLGLVFVTPPATDDKDLLAGPDEPAPTDILSDDDLFYIASALITSGVLETCP